MPTETDKLKIKLIQPTDMFADDAFNNVIKDLDNKVVGIAHLTSGAHWEVWTKDTDYAKGDIVRTPYLKSNQYLECINAGKTGTDCPNDNIPGTMITDNTAKWIIRVLGAVDESTISIWIGGEEYGRGSLVLYNNKLYRCKVSHTATTFDVDASKWQEVFASLQEWRATFYYALNDTVLYNGKLFKCILANDDTVFDSNKWSLINNLSIVHPYEQNTNYMEGQLATVNGKLYKSKTTHLSPTGNFTDDKINWENIYSDIVMWNKNVDYYVGDIVSFDDVMYICKIAHTSSSISFKLDKDNWNIYHTPSSFIKDWVANTVYESEQVVRYKKRIYRCKVKNDDFSWNESNWELINLDIEDWVASTNYYVGQYVSYNGALYRCITANSDSTWTGSNWKKVSGGIDNWVTGSSYSIDDLVIYNDKIYQCKTAHTSTTFNVDEANWKEISSYTIHIDNWAASTAYKARDLVVYDAQIYRCTLAHTSTTDLISDIQNWELLSNIQDWESNKTYIQGNIVLYDNTPYKVIKNHVSNDFSLDKDNFELTYSNIRDFNPTMFYKKGSYVLYNNNIYKALKDTTGDISSHLQLQSSASFRDTNNIYTKVIRTIDKQVKLFTEPNGNYINTVIDLGNIYDITRITLSNLRTGYCDPGETIIETSTDGTSYIKANSFAKNYWDNTDSFQLNINEKARYIKIVFKSVYKRGGNDFDFKNVSIYTANTDWQKITNTQKSSVERWETNTEYKKNEIVVYNEKIYKCAIDHTSGTDFSVDKPKYWESLSENPIINDWISGNNYEVGTCIINSNQNRIVDWTASKQYNVNDEVVYNGYIYTCKTQNTDTEFTESNWEVKEPVYNRIYRCIKNTNSKDFNESEWQLINGDSKATVGEVDELLA